MYIYMIFKIFSGACLSLSEGLRQRKWVCSEGLLPLLDGGLRRWQDMCDQKMVSSSFNCYHFACWPMHNENSVFLVAQV